MDRMEIVGTYYGSNIFLTILLIFDKRKSGSILTYIYWLI